MLRPTTIIKIEAVFYYDDDVMSTLQLLKKHKDDPIAGRLASLGYDFKIMEIKQEFDDDDD